VSRWRSTRRRIWVAEFRDWVLTDDIRAWRVAYLRKVAS
jgi:hypothetical protein